jgi:hypothetical protein
VRGFGPAFSVRGRRRSHVGGFSFGAESFGSTLFSYASAAAKP